MSWRDQSRGGASAAGALCRGGAGQELLAVLARDRRRRFQPNTDATPVIDEGALHSYLFDDILGGQNRRHFTALARARSPRPKLWLLFPGSRTHDFCPVIPDIGIWRAASLMLKSSAANEGDHDGAAIWRLITDAVAQLANTTPSGPVH